MEEKQFETGVPQNDTAPQPDYNNVPTTAPDFSAYSTDSISGAQPAKQKKGWKVALASVLSVVVVLGAGSGIAYAVNDTVKNFVKLNLGSDDNYYAWVVENNMKTWGRHMSESYEAQLDLSKKEPQSDLTLDVTLSDDAKAALTELIGQELDLTTAKLVGSGEVSGDSVGVDLSLMLNDKDVLAANALIQEETIYMQIPTLSEEYLSMPLQTIFSTTGAAEGMDFSSLFMTPTKMEEALSPSDLNGLFESYGKLLSESKADVTVAKDTTLSIGETEFSYTAVTATYKGEAFQTVAEDLLTRLKDDKTVQGFLTGYAAMTESDYTDGIQSVLDEIQQNPVDETNGIVLTLYVDPTGTIRGCNLADAANAEDSMVDFYMGQDGDQLGIYCDIADEMTLEGVLTESGKDCYNGTITMDMGTDGKGEVAVTDFTIENEDYGYCRGTMTFTMPELTDAFTVKMDSDGKSQTITADIAAEGTNYATVSITASTAEGGKINMEVPANAVDMETGMESYLENANTEAFISNLEAALGIENLEELMSSTATIDPEEEIIAGGNADDDLILDTNEDIMVEDVPETTQPAEESAVAEEESYAEFEADLSKTAITYNGKPFTFWENNQELIGMVDISATPTLEPADFDWFYNADGMMGIGLENTNANAVCDTITSAVFELEVYEGAPIDVKINSTLGIGSPVADVCSAFGITATPEMETAEYYVVSIYDTASDGALFYSFYLENGVVKALDLADYS